MKAEVFRILLHGVALALSSSLLGCRSTDSPQLAASAPSAGDGVKAGGHADSLAGFEQHLVSLKRHWAKVTVECHELTRVPSRLAGGQRISSAELRQLLNDDGWSQLDSKKWDADSLSIAESCELGKRLSETQYRAFAYSTEELADTEGNTASSPLRPIKGYLKSRRWYAVDFVGSSHQRRAEFVNIDGSFRSFPDPAPYFVTPAYVGSCMPSWPWIERREIDEATLKLIEQPAPAACDHEVTGTVRRIRNSLFMDGIVEPPPGYDDHRPEPADLASWRCAPTLLFPRIDGDVKATLAGFSSVVAGAPRAGVPHFVVWASDLQDATPDQLLILNERSLRAKPILRAQEGERFLLLGRFGRNALLLVTRGQRPSALRLMDPAGESRGRYDLPPLDAGDLNAIGELPANRYEPLTPEQSLLILDRPYLMTVEGSRISAVPLDLEAGLILRDDRRAFFERKDRRCSDLAALLHRAGTGRLTAEHFSALSAMPCPKAAAPLPWYEYLPLPVDGTRQPFVANVAGCLVRSAIRLPMARQLPESLQDDASTSPAVHTQSVKVTLNELPMDPTLSIALQYSGGRFSVGVGDQLPEFNDRKVIFRLSIPPHSIEGLQRAAARSDSVHRIKLDYPGYRTDAFPTWPNDCHEGSLMIRTHHTLTPSYLMYGYCE